MSIKKEDATIVGVGAAACVACCAGPIMGFVAAIGIGSAAGFALFGTISLLIGALAVVLVIRRRRRAITRSNAPATVALEMPTVRVHQ